jgi:hypothetical protein
VSEIKKTKRFGVVFEGHPPKSVRIPRLPVCKGSHAARKGQPGNEIYHVVDIKGNLAFYMPERKATYQKEAESGYP